MEGSGFETGTRAPGRAGPSFEPPEDPAGGGSRHGLSLIARIMRGRELAAEAAGLPPLDADQVLDLQRTAGNQLTSGALARWTDPLGGGDAAEALAPFATPEAAARQATPDLLDSLLPARAAHAAAHAAICAELDVRDPRVAVRLTCTAAPDPPLPYAIEARGPAGGSAAGTAELAAGLVVTIELPFSAAFGAAAGIAPGSALALRVTAPDGSAAALELPVPFAAPGALALGDLRLVALAETA